MFNVTSIYKEKKCGYCQRILPISDFEKYGGERGKKEGLQSFRSICKSCRSKRKIIRELRNKLKLLIEFFNGKCNNCSISLLHLPSIEFHHQKKALKKKSWRNIRNKSYETLSKWVIDEKLIALCSNCHLKEQAKYLNEFEDLIMKSDLFKHDQNEIEFLLDKHIRNHPKYKNYKAKSKIKYQIKRWIRKRYVIEQLYNGECVVCRLKSKTNLASMNFHHKEKTLNKKSNWQSLQDKDSFDISHTLIVEKCICLCSNCHSLLHSNYLENIRSISRTILSKEKTLELYSKLEKIVKNLKNSISNFTFNIENVNFRSPLKYEISPDEIWKVKILELYNLLKIKRVKSFRTKDIESISNNNYHNAYHTISTLLKKGYLNDINRKGFTQNYYSFSQKGIEKLNALVAQFKEKNAEIEEEVRQLEIHKNDQNKRLENDDILLIYPKLIKEIIGEKGYNEFIVKDLAKVVGRTTGNVSRILNEKLIPRGIVEICDMHPNTKTRGSTKVYRLSSDN
jgi:DNA-binding PadR family transcriptional regulator